MSGSGVCVCFCFCCSTFSWRVWQEARSRWFPSAPSVGTPLVFSSPSHCLHKPDLDSPPVPCNSISNVVFPVKLFSECLLFPAKIPQFLSRTFSNACSLCFFPRLVSCPIDTVFPASCYKWPPVQLLYPTSVAFFVIILVLVFSRSHCVFC